MLGSKLLRKARAPYEGVELGHYYPEPWPVNRSTTLQFWWRFWLGRPMDNEIRTNCTFWRSATSGYPSRWARLAGWQRLAFRLAGVWSVLVVLPLLTLTAVSVLLDWEQGAGALRMLLLVSALPLLLPAGALTLRSLIREHGLTLPAWERVELEGAGAERSRFYERWAYAPKTIVQGSREWERSVVLPLAKALAPQLHRPYHPDTVTQWCIVPRDYANSDGAPVRILLPPQYAGVDARANQRLVRTVKTRLALDDMMASWLLENTDRPELRMVTPPAPPPFLSFADVLHHLEQAKEYEPFLGLVAGGAGLHIQMVGDGPHTAVNSATGGGKTTLLKLLTCQLRHWGWLPVILDWKRSEANMWAWNLPGVRVISDIEKIHDFGVDLAEELDYRRNASPEERETLPRIAVIRNEWNATAEMLMTYWQDYRASLEPSERATINPKSPALRGYANTIFCGRELGVFDVVEAQRLSARVFNGNADVRENYRNKLMARYTYSTVRMLVSDPAKVRTFPKAPKEVGRWVVMAGEDVHVVQVPYLTNDEARAFALSGKPGVASPWSTRRPNAVQVPSTQGEPVGSDPTRALAGSPVQPMRLAEIVSDIAHLGITLDVLHNERKRNPDDFPESVGGNPNTGLLYRPWEVIEWARRRHARMTAEKGAK